MPDYVDQHDPLVEVLVEHLPGRTVAALVGELDMSNAEDVLRRLTEVAGSAGADGLLEVDLSRLGFLDSAGIAALHRLHRDLSGSTEPGEPGRLRVLAPPDSVAGRTLRLAGMHQVLPMPQDDGAA